MTNVDADRRAKVTPISEGRRIRRRKAGLPAGFVGSEDGVRTMTPVGSRSRRRCSCCGARATHVGLGDGVALMMGCEWRVRQWCRNPRAERAATKRRRARREEVSRG